MLSRMVWPLALHDRQYVLNTKGFVDTLRSYLLAAISVSLRATRAGRVARRDAENTETESEVFDGANAKRQPPADLWFPGIHFLRGLLKLSAQLRKPRLLGVQ